MKAFLTSIIWAFTGAVLVAQITATQYETKHHEIGFQANGLINSIFNTGADIGNPYTLRYNYLFSEKQAVSAGLGFAYTLNEFETGGEVRESNLDLRIGYLYFHSFTKNLRIGFGADIGMQRYNTRSITAQGPGFSDSTVLKTNQIENLIVLGPRLTLDYNLTNYLSLGTEVNLYFKKGIERLEFTSTTYDRFTGETRSFFANKNEDSVEQFRISSPVAIYLTLRL